MKKEEKEAKQRIWLLKRAGLVAFVLIVILSGGLSFYAGNALAPARVETVAETTITDVQSTTYSSFGTVSTTETQILTTTFTFTEFIEVLRTLPPSVNVSGTVVTSGAGTTPTRLEFINQEAGIRLEVNVVGGRFGPVALPNDLVYQVRVHYDLTPIGSGVCENIAFGLSTVKESWEVAIRC